MKRAMKLTKTAKKSQRSRSAVIYHELVQRCAQQLDLAMKCADDFGRAATKLETIKKTGDKGAVERAQAAMKVARRWKDDQWSSVGLSLWMLYSCNGDDLSKTLSDVALAKRGKLRVGVATNDDLIREVINHARFKYAPGKKSCISNILFKPTPKQIGNVLPAAATRRRMSEVPDIRSVLRRAEQLGYR